MSAALALAACTQNDDEITRRVRDRLTNDGIADQVQVSTQRRIVTLEGVVNDVPEMNRAEMAARNVPGILGVDNRIVVKNPVNITGGQMEPPRAP
jgi:osmotically-inducible protein OsmY